MDDKEEKDKWNARKRGVVDPDIRVAIICGGPSEERGISLNSARSLLDHLRCTGSYMAGSLLGFEVRDLLSCMGFMLEFGWCLGWGLVVVRAFVGPPAF